MHFPNGVLVRGETQTTSAWIWTWGSDSIYYDGNRWNKRASFHNPHQVAPPSQQNPVCPTISAIGGREKKIGSCFSRGCELKLNATSYVRNLNLENDKDVTA